MIDGFDVVRKAKHYNSHPSGIEVKHVVRSLNFNLGCVFKYVVRRNDKEPVRSLESAVWYLNDHLENSADCPVVPDNKLNQVVLMVQRFASSEPDPVASQFFEAFAVLLVTPRSLVAHRAVNYYLERLLWGTRRAVNGVA